MNLPPGCRITDIPGFRPGDDEEDEAELDELENKEENDDDDNEDAGD